MQLLVDEGESSNEEENSAAGELDSGNLQNKKSLKIIYDDFRENFYENPRTNIRESWAPAELGKGQVIYKITQNSHLKKKPVSVSIIRKDVKWTKEWNQSMTQLLIRITQCWNQAMAKAFPSSWRKDRWKFHPLGQMGPIAICSKGKTHKTKY